MRDDQRAGQERIESANSGYTRRRDRATPGTVELGGTCYLDYTRARVPEPPWKQG
jgi:hypothetical protein